MSLRLKFLIGLTLLFTLLMVGLFVERVHSTRQYVEAQLASTAQDAASSLVYPISRALGKDDVILAEIAIKSLLDRGYYQRIEIVALSGKTMAKMEQSKRIDGVPAWFLAWQHLEPAPGSALISDGWRQLGRVVVISEPALAYKQLWDVLTHTLALLLIAYVISLLVMNFLVRILLQPLTAIEKSANEVQEREFNPINVIPSTREFRRVVQAFNLMIERVRQFLTLEQQRAEEYRHQAFTDATTGLDNRRNLDLRLDGVLKKLPHDSIGAAFAIQLEDLSQLNNREGYQKGDAILKNIANILLDKMGKQSPLIARLNGTTLFALRFDLSSEQIDQMGDQILASLKIMRSDIPVQYGLAIVDFANGTLKSKLLSSTDLALQQALFNGGASFQRLSANESSNQLGSQQWREVLQAAIQGKTWGIQAQVVQTIANKAPLHQELTARLRNQDGPWISAGLFMPMAARHGLLQAAEQSLFDLAIDKLENAAVLQGQSIALNVGLLGALGSVAGQDEFVARLTKLKKHAARIAFEVPEHQLLAMPELALRFARLLRDAGFGFGIDQFGFSASAATLIRELKPQYVKIDRRLIIDMVEHKDTREMILSLIQVAESLNITTIAQGIETESQIALLNTMKISAMQGYYLGRPSEVI
ncbi:MAG: EAL domain-containing protein [Burkholderiales bacterium]|nr:EAL domain-containing protein [Burkholderiales bacterium]